jgi:hypothetical protein
MHRIAPLLVTAALVLGTVAVAAPVGASAPAKTSAFCKGVKNLDLPNPGEEFSEETADSAARQLRKLASKAKGSTRKATKTMASAFEDIGDGGDAEDLLTSEYAGAVGIFTLAAVKCLAGGIELPDITLPGS